MPLLNDVSLNPLYSPVDYDSSEPPNACMTPMAFRETKVTAHLSRHNSASDPMTTTTKRRMFPTSSMRSSATASSAAAVSAAFRLKSNLSTATKLPIARQRPTAIRSGTVPDGSTAVREECPVKSLARSHTESAAGKQHDQAKTASQRFAMSSIMRLRTVSKDKVHSKLAAVTHLKKSHGGRLKRCTSTNSSGTYADSEEEAELNGECTSSKAHKSAMTSASRFVKGMPTMLRRAVSTNNPLDEAQTSPFDGSDCYTPQDETATDDTEDDRQSLLLMLQVPQTRRYSQLPLMAASEGW